MRLFLITTLLAVICGPANAAGGEQGTAWIDVSLDKDGNVLDASVEQAPAALAGPIESWARATVFEPAVADGQTVPSTTSVLLVFSLEEVEGGYDLRFLSYTTGPRPIKIREPRYPRRSLEKGLEGWARVGFTVGPTGDVEDPKIIESSHDSFAGAAIKSIRQWKFKVPTVDGIPVRYEMERRIDFSLDR